VTIYPADEFRITCTIAYDHPLIGTQTCDFLIDRETFEKEISPRPGPLASSTR
jgi:UDP-3-O-[3-hydroxymyristoyl] N-acetylglucosamine deacetylase